jgi:biopolymer transport protein ExbD
MASKVLSESEDDVIAEINIVPFVDIVLVLLITFMLTSSAIVRASIPVELPTAASADSIAQSSLNVVLDRSGGLFLDAKPTTLGELATHVARASWREERLQAVISADRGIEYGRVVQVIDIIKSNGIKTFALNIQREP